MLPCARRARHSFCGYVAMERVTGTLKGRSGGFVLQHSATMTRGTPVSTIVFMPDPPAVSYAKSAAR
jgi:Protein of unknown function (DUF3224)